MTDYPFLDEIKNQYNELRYGGLSRAESEQTLMQDYANELNFGTMDDKLLFWIALADAQFKRKELSIEVAQHALESLDILEKNYPDISLDNMMRLRKNCSNAPMPERKRLPKRKKFRCQWSIGDTFAYRISGEAAELAGQYALLRKVDDIEFGDGRLLPIVTVSLWNHDKLPQNEYEFQTVPPLRMECGRLGTPSTKFEYRAEVLFKNKKQLSALQLQFIGNFPSVAMPDDEVVFTNPGHLMMILPEQLSEDCRSFWKMDQYYSSIFRSE